MIFALLFLYDVLFSDFLVFFGFNDNHQIDVQMVKGG